MTRRAQLGLIVVILALPLLLFGSVALQSRQRHADAAPEALAMSSTADPSVVIESGPYLVLRPRGGNERALGVIVYPGAYVDVRGYVPTLRPLAAAGYRVVVVPMPFELAMLGLNRALDVAAANPEVGRWALIGHSHGGAMAGAFVSRHPESIAGLVIWDSYPALSLVDYPRPVWHVHRATPDGAPPAKFAAKRGQFPPHSRWMPIRGGVHLYFGAFAGGGYREDWAPSISREEQWRQVVAATLEALEDIERAAQKNGA